MQQVLLRIPLKADWLPAGLPLWLVLLAVFLLLAAALYWGGSRLASRWYIDPKSVQGAAAWVAVAGVIVAGLAYFFADTGLPIYGFGMMLFLAFLVCTWVAGRRAEREGVLREVIQDLAIWLFLGGLVVPASPLYLTQDPGPGEPSTFIDFLKQLPLDLGRRHHPLRSGPGCSGRPMPSLTGWSFASRAISTLKLADILAPSIALGICLGRVGCFLNGCCYGQVVCPDFAQSSPSRSRCRRRSRYELVKNGYQTAGRLHARVPAGRGRRRRGGPGRSRGSAAAAQRAEAGRRDRCTADGKRIDQRPGGPRSVHGPTSAPGRAAKTT